MSTATATRPATSPVEARGAAAVAALALIASVIVAPPWAGSVLPPGQAAQLVDGAMERQVGDGWVGVSVGSFLAGGTRVRTPDDRAVLALEDGQLTLARGTELIVRGDGYDLDRGRVLAEVERVVTGRWGTLAATGRGAWRLDTGVAPRVAVYRGGVGVSLQDTSREVPVRAYQQVDVVDGAPADATVPLRYEATDPWDARLLTEALAIDRQASQLLQGLRAQYGTGDRPAGIYDDFEAGETVTAAALAELSERSGSRYGPPAEVLLNLVVVDLLTRGAALGSEEAVARVSQLRRAGATYGIVLRMHDLRAQDLVDAFEVALIRRAEQVAANPPPTSGPTTEPTASPSPTASPTSQPSPEPSPSEPPPEDPSPEPSEPGVTDPIDPIVDELPDPIEEPVDDVTDIIDDVGDQLPTGLDR